MKMEIILTMDIFGGEILKRNNYKYWKEIYYHGDVNTEYTSLFLEILNKADMQIDKFGKDVGYEWVMREGSYFRTPSMIFRFFDCRHISIIIFLKSHYFLQFQMNKA